MLRLEAAVVSFSVLSFLMRAECVSRWPQREVDIQTSDIPAVRRGWWWRVGVGHLEGKRHEVTDV